MRQAAGVRGRTPPLSRGPSSGAVTGGDPLQGVVLNKDRELPMMLRGGSFSGAQTVTAGKGAGKPPSRAASSMSMVQPSRAATPVGDDALKAGGFQMPRPSHEPSKEVPGVINATHLHGLPDTGRSTPVNSRKTFLEGAGAAPRDGSPSRASRAASRAVTPGGTSMLNRSSMKQFVTVARDKAETTKRELLALWKSTSIAEEKAYKSFDILLGGRAADRYSRAVPPPAFTSSEKQELKQKYSRAVDKARKDSEGRGDVQEVTLLIDAILEAFIQAVSGANQEENVLEGVRDALTQAHEAQRPKSRLHDAPGSWFERNQEQVTGQVDEEGNPTLNIDYVEQAGLLRAKLEATIKKLNASEMEVDLLTGHLTRRNQLLEQQRAAYFKDLLLMKEQLFKKEENPNYQAEDWGGYFDLKGFHELLWQGIETKDQKQTQREMAEELEREKTKLKSTLVAERKKIEAAAQQEMLRREEEFDHKLQEMEAEWGARFVKVQENETLLREQLNSVEARQARDKQRMERTHHEEINKIKRELEERVDATGLQANKQLQELEETARRRQEMYKAELRKLTQQHADDMAAKDNELQQTQKALDDLQDKLQADKRKAHTSNTRNLSLEQEMADLKDKLGFQDLLLNDAHQEVAALKERIERISIVYEDMLGRMAVKNDRLRESVEQIESAHSVGSDSQAALLAKLARAQRDLVAAQKATNDKHTNFSIEIDRRHKHLLEEVDQARYEMEKAQSREQEHKDALISSQSSAKRMQATIAEHEATIGGLKAEAETLRKLTDAATKERDKMVKEHEMVMMALKSRHGDGDEEGRRLLAELTRPPAPTPKRPASAEEEPDTAKEKAYVNTLRILDRMQERRAPTLERAEARRRALEEASRNNWENVLMSTNKMNGPGDGRSSPEERLPTRSSSQARQASPFELGFDASSRGPGSPAVSRPNSPRRISRPASRPAIEQEYEEELQERRRERIRSASPRSPRSRTPPQRSRTPSPRPGSRGQSPREIVRPQVTTGTQREFTRLPPSSGRESFVDPPTEEEMMIGAPRYVLSEQEAVADTAVARGAGRVQRGTTAGARGVWAPANPQQPEGRQAPARRPKSPPMEFVIPARASHRVGGMEVAYITLEAPAGTLPRNRTGQYAGGPAPRGGGADNGPPLLISGLGGGDQPRVAASKTGPRKATERGARPSRGQRDTFTDELEQENREIIHHEIEKVEHQIGVYKDYHSEEE